MPASCSAPMEPYLKRISGVDVTHAGCGSSRKILYHPVIAAITPSKTTITSQIFQPVRFFCPSAILPPATQACANLPYVSSPVILNEVTQTFNRLLKQHSECLQILDKSVFLIRRKLGSVTCSLVPRVGIPGLLGVVKKIFLALFFRNVCNEPDHLLVVDVIAAIKICRPLVTRLK